MKLIAIGGNLPGINGSALKNCEQALSLLPDHGINLVKLSNWYETDPWPETEETATQPKFVNAVAEISTDLDHFQTIKTLHKIENILGRTRQIRNEARIVDLDLLDFDGVVIEDVLTLPHPRMHNRSFVLVPLRDVNPNWKHPVTGDTLQHLIQQISPLTGIYPLKNRKIA